MRLTAFAALAWLLLHAGAALAQQVPPELESWKSWVMYGEEFRRCPMRQAIKAEGSNAFACLWPGRMRVAVSSAGGNFSQRWRVYAEDWVRLPGDATHWPESVRVNGNPVPVAPHDGLPRLRLKPGEYTVSGEFTWSRRPESLRLPPSTALVDLSIDGRTIAPIDLREDRLWLGAVRTVTMPRALQVQMYRLLQDDIPLLLTTQLRLQVSGDAREELLAPVLPEGFVPMSVNGELPMRFESDGRLRVQVRSGEHVLTVAARATSPADSIAAPGGEGMKAQEEIWSYRSNDRMRITAIEAVAQVDPVQAGVPAEWRQLPAFRLAPGATIRIAQRNRGLGSADANRLTLRRDLWLAFDRGSFTAADRISGTMQQGWRLDMASPYRLLNARHKEETLLITDGEQGHTGVEIRTPAVEVTTLARVAANGPQPATGWNARFENVFTTLHLPPGHRLFAAWGVDHAPDTWLSRWRLLDLFLLMLVAAAAFRLLGWPGGAVAALAIVLTHHEASSPSWLWVNALVAIAVARVVSEGRLRRTVRGYQALSFAVLIMALLPFAIAQYRLAIHPQLPDQPTHAASGLASGLAYGLAQETRAIEAAPVGRADQSPAFVPPVMLQMPASKRAIEDEAARRLERYAPGAMLQTGPGIPDWRYLSHQLSWSGPVAAEQTVRLMILSPLWLSLWRVSGLLLCAALVLMLIRLAYGIPGNLRLPPWRAAASLGGLGLSILLFASMPQLAEAQTPDAGVLAELKKRLSEPAKCVPDCSQVVVATVDVSDDRLEVQMEAHAQANVALGVPQAGPQWIVERVLVNGQPSDSLARSGGRLYLPLIPGVHRVSVTGRIAQADELSLEFPQPPRRIVVRTRGWDSSGSSEGRLLNSALQLTRRAGAEVIARASAQRFAPFVRVHRQVFMNLDWTVSTVVERLAPEKGAFTLRLPLLPGEAVLTPGLEVRDGTVLVSMPSGEQFARWESSLSTVDKQQWIAADGTLWVEQWDVIVSPMWHAQFSGTPAIMPSQYAQRMWVNQFLPRPGESLDLAVSRPAASAGATLAVDRVDVSTRFGQRLSDTHLKFSYRSSQGGRHELRIPEDARVQSVSVDGQSLPLRPTDGLLPLTLIPGQHTVDLAFSRDKGAGLVSRPPLIDLGAEGTNVSTSLALDRNRWVLFAWGKGVGPAILYWGELVLFAAVAIVLGRLRQTPLGTRDWLFLGLGLSTFSWWVLLVFGAWLFLLERRNRWNIQTRWRFNTVQLALGLVSLAVLVMLISAIPYGLLGQPDMNIRSDARGMYVEALSWFVDSTAAQLPQPGVFSVSIWFYKLAMLLWALWLSFALLRWLPWTWRQYSAQGWWRGKVVAE